MARRTQDFEHDPVIVPIEDGTDTSLPAMAAWRRDLRRDEPVALSVSVVDVVREIRENGEE